jgi:hypothetical protein
MKKLILICTIALGFGFSASAQTADTKGEFKFTEEKHDFGKVPQGKPVTTTFEFTNLGPDPILVTAAQPQCGCTIADFTKTPVAKGEKGKITATYNAIAVGFFNKSITVTSNAKTPSKVLIITGEVLAPGTPAPATGTGTTGK